MIAAGYESLIVRLIKDFIWFLVGYDFYAANCVFS